MKKLLSLLTAATVLFVFVACSNDSSSVSQSQPAPSSSSQLASEPDPLNQAFLTGLEKDENYPEGQRIAAVMVNNIAASRPTKGLSSAQILYEIKVEGGITRFMAVFEDYKSIPTIGSMRSARDQFFQLLIPYWGYYIHEGPGGDHPVNWMMRDYDYYEFDVQPKDGNLRFQDPNRAGRMPSEYTWYTDAEHIADTIENKESDDYRAYGTPIFNFVPYNEEPRVPSEGEADEVAVIHSASYRTFFEYNASDARYYMSQFNSSRGGVEATIDENNGDQLSFDNVIVLFAPMTLYANSPLVKVDYSVGGAGYYFTQGGYELVFWRKGAANQPLILEVANGDGEHVQVNTGTTYVAIVDDQELPTFHENLKAGTGNEAVASGEVNQNEEELED